MTASPFLAHARAAVLAAVIGLSGVAAAQPQPQPSPATLALAKEVITVKGAVSMYDPVLVGVIEQGKNVLMQQNPMLSRDLNEVAGRLRNDMRARTGELTDDIARLYAGRFTEQELKDVLAFYKSPLGQKVIKEEPQILDASVAQAQAWANKLSEEVLEKFRIEMKKKGHDL
jgi:hypothetical protein